MSGTYGMIGQVNIGEDSYLIGSTLFATSPSRADAETKVANLQSSATYVHATGVTIHVKFTNANEVTDSTKLKLQVGSSTAQLISNPNGSLSWAAGSTISFTNDGTKWIMNSSAIDGSSIQNLSLGNITNAGELGTASALVVTNSNKEITTGETFSSTITNQTTSHKFLREDGTFATPSYIADTHYTATLAVGDAATDTASEAVTASTEGVYVNIVENSAVSSSLQFAGSGGITIGSTAAGKITFAGTAGTVTSVQVQATSPVVSSTDSAQSSTLNTTISLADAYGDTKNPYGTKSPHYILAGPSSGTTAAAPAFRELVSADIPASVGLTGYPTVTYTNTLAASDNSTTIATAEFVQSAINNKLASNDAMLFKGTIGTGGTITTVPNGKSNNSSAPVDQTYQAGYTYRVITAGTYAGQKCEVGDLLIAIHDSISNQTDIENSHWTVAQTNIDGALYKGTTYTSGQLLVAGESGAVTTSGYTIATPSTGSILYGGDSTYSSLTTTGASAGQVLTLTNNNGSLIPTWASNVASSALYVNATADGAASGSSPADAPVNSGSTYIHFYNDTTKQSTISLTGTGGTTITATASKAITISSQQYWAVNGANALTSLTLGYSSTTESVTSETASQIGYVNGGILYIKSITFGTTSVTTSLTSTEPTT